MKAAKFTENKYKIIIYCGLYALFCEVVSLAIIGPRLDFAIGILAGTITVIVNFVLLEKFAETFLFEKKAKVAFLLQLGRYLLYGIVAFICVEISLCCGVGYSVGILGLSIAIVIKYGIGGLKDEC